MGGFGEVYYATSDAGKEVALKLIRRNLDVELRGMRQCLNLKHPNLLSLFDIREDDGGDTWIVMEYIAGKSLEDVVAAHPRGMPADEAMHWFRGIAAGVAYLHDHGIVHRDLKPGNVFSDGGIVKVGDYGLSKFISCSRRSGHTESIGTVHYMAPEVAHGRYGKELDIYALGAILYELLTGRVPFDGESVGEVLMKHLTAVPDVSSLPEPYRTAVARALDKDPACWRFATVGEMMTALDGGGSPAFSQSGWRPRDVKLSEGSMAGQRAASYRTPVIPVAEPVSAHEAAEIIDDANEEPIARAVRRGLAHVRHSWRTAALPQWLKVLDHCLGAIFVLLPMTYVLVPAAVAVTLLYVFYRVVRWFWLLLFAPPTARPVLRRTLLMPRQAASPQSPHATAAAALRAKPKVVRARELVRLALNRGGGDGVDVRRHDAGRGPQQQYPQSNLGNAAWLFLVSLAGRLDRDRGGQVLGEPRRRTDAAAVHSDDAWTGPGTGGVRRGRIVPCAPAAECGSNHTEWLVAVQLLSGRPANGNGVHGCLRSVVGAGAMVASERSPACDAAQPGVAHR